MDNSKIEKFVEKLSAETIQSKISWEHAYQFETIDYDSNPNVANIFFSNEFHQVILEDSYFAPIPPGAIIFIIFEASQSGRDGTHIRCYNIYIQDANNNVSKLSCAQGHIYQLVNSIKSYLAKKEKPLENFIDSYLSATDNTNQ